MTNEQKARFVNQLCNSIRDEVLSKINMMPENWNGHELRRLLADKFDESASFPASGTTPYARVRKEYNEARVLLNL